MTEDCDHKNLRWGGDSFFKTDGLGHASDLNDDHDNLGEDGRYVAPLIECVDCEKSWYAIPCSDGQAKGGK